MNLIQQLLLIVMVLIIFAMIYGYYDSKQTISLNPFMDKKLFQRGLNKPVIWLYYDQSDVNAREWLDFGARSSRALQVPFLNLCYQTIVQHNQDRYRIEVIGGLAGVSELLGGWNQLPPGLQDPLSPVNEAEINYIRAAILSKYGGLWLEPSSICMKEFGELPHDKVVFFGTDLDETYAGDAGTVVPGFRAVWSPSSSHPLFQAWEKECYERVASKKGGEQIRGDAKWDFVRFSSEFASQGIVVDPHAEGMRKKNGKRIQLEDLLASGTDGVLPFDIYPHTVYVPFPWNELRDRQSFGWFLRTSEEQIMKSDVAVKYLLQRSLSNQ
jgi:hypothetical protein